MPKIGRAQGATISGAVQTDGYPTLVAADNLRVTGVIEFAAPDGGSDLRIYRASDGTLAGAGLSAIADDRLLGNVSGSSASPVALTAAQVDAFLADAYPWVFNVQDAAYGAVADGTTDDTAAIQAAIDAAYAYAIANETCYAEIYFPPSESSYVISGALVAGGTTKGNAQLTIPIRAGTARKVTLVFRGGVDAAAMPYWEQTVGQRWGVTLKTTLTGLSNSATWGVPSVIGGPAVSGSSATYGSSTATFNNVCCIFIGIGISAPLEPTLGGFDMAGCAQAIFERCAFMADDDPTALNAHTYANDWTFGFRLPQNFNNDRNIIYDCSVYGVYTAFIIGEHAWVDRTASIYCYTGMFVHGTSENIHGSAFGSISIEGCEVGFTTNGGDSYGVPIHVAMCSFETIGSYHIDDNSNSFSGTFNIVKLDGPTGISIRGASNVRVVNMNQDLGLLTAPNVPASTVAHENVFFVDCDVLVSGGTVTEVTIDGEATGLTGGWFPVRSGGTIAITYSVAPTWKWWAR